MTEESGNYGSDNQSTQKRKLNVEEINKALEPLGWTVGEIYRVRAREIDELEMAIKNLRQERYNSGLHWTESGYERMTIEIKELKEKRDKLIYEP